MLIFYVEKINQRIKYIFDFVFTEILITKYKIVDNLQEFHDSEGYKLAYAKTEIENMPFLYMKTIMAVNDIIEMEISKGTVNDIPVIFYHNKEKSILPFDPFAAAFYMMTRYEEYLMHKRDNHKRYDFSNSIAYELKVLHEPIVHVWINILHDKLCEMYPDIEFQKRKYRFLPTIDVDHAYKYKYKGLIRTNGGIIKSMLTGEIKEAIDKVLCIWGLKKDPYDTFDRIFLLKRKYKLDMIFFFLLAFEGKYNKSNDPTNFQYQRLIRHVFDFAEVGAHFSYDSYNDLKLMEEERKLLQDILHINVNMSRQHFLRFEMPITYQNLYDNEIKYDFSMAYAPRTGFRAGVCVPFKFFDLEENVSTELVIYPVSVMDVTLINYMNLCFDAALTEIKRIVKEVKKYNGVFVPLWHNSSLADEGKWKNKTSLFEEMIKLGASK